MPVVNVPLNPAFSSLNLGQAVLLVILRMAFTAGDATPERRLDYEEDAPPPTQGPAGQHVRASGAGAGRRQLLPGAGEAAEHGSATSAPSCSAPSCRSRRCGRCTASSSPWPVRGRAGNRRYWGRISGASESPSPSRRQRGGPLPLPEEREAQAGCSTPLPGRGRNRDSDFGGGVAPAHPSVSTESRDHAAGPVIRPAQPETAAATVRRWSAAVKPETLLRGFRSWSPSSSHSSSIRSDRA